MEDKDVSAHLGGGKEVQQRGQPGDAPAQPEEGGAHFWSMLQTIRISCSKQWPLNYYCSLSRPLSFCTLTSL